MNTTRRDTIDQPPVAIVDNPREVPAEDPHPLPPNPDTPTPPMMYYIFAILVPSLIPITSIVCATICELHDKSLCSIALFLLALLTLPKYIVSSKKS